MIESRSPVRNLQEGTTPSDVTVRQENTLCPTTAPELKLDTLQSFTLSFIP